MSDYHKIGGIPLCTIKLGFYTAGANATFTSALMAHASTARNSENNKAYFAMVPFKMGVYAFSFANDDDTNDGNTDGMTVTIQVVKATGANSQTPTNLGSAQSLTMVNGELYRNYEVFSTNPTLAEGESIGVLISTDQIAHNEISVLLWCYQYI